MTEITLEFIAERLERIQTEQAAMRAQFAGMQATLADLQADGTVLATMVLRVERGIVQIKDILARVDSRVDKLEHA